MVISRLDPLDFYFNRISLGGCRISGSKESVWTLERCCLKHKVTARWCDPQTQGRPQPGLEGLFQLQAWCKVGLLTLPPEHPKPWRGANTHHQGHQSSPLLS